MPKRHRRPPDPLRNALARVVWDGLTIPRVTVVGPLLRTTEVIEFRDGGSPGTVQHLPGKSAWTPLVIRRPVTSDTAFESWANLLTQSGTGVSNIRKTVRIELYTPAGRVVRAYTLHRCWVQSYEALPILVNGRESQTIETLTLHYDGWERDTTIGP